jgi:hypothetical protein
VCPISIIHSQGCVGGTCRNLNTVHCIVFLVNLLTIRVRDINIYMDIKRGKTLVSLLKRPISFCANTSILIAAHMSQLNTKIRLVITKYKKKKLKRKQRKLEITSHFKIDLLSSRVMLPFGRPTFTWDHCMTSRDSMNLYLT